jgi:signal transduction histidine kinase
MLFRRKGRGLASAVLVAIVGGALTGVAAYAAWLFDEDTKASELARTGEVVTGAIEDTINSAITQLRSAQALFEASDDVSAVEFSQFALYQGASPGMVAIGFARIVPPDEWMAFTIAARRERPQYVVQDLGRRAMIGPPENRDAVPVWYVHHRRIAPGLLGVDLADDPERRAAITRAVENDVPAITGHMSVLGSTGDYVEIYIPVQSVSGGGPGVVFTQIDLFDLVTAIVDTSDDDPTIRISDVTGSGVATPDNGPDRWSDRIRVADRTWEVTVVDRDMPLLPPFTATVAAAGAAITLLASVLTAAATSARERRRQLDDLLARAREKDVFLATVAHELRTPLTSVVGAAALLAEQWQHLEPTEIEELLQAVHSEATDLSDLIEDFLVAGRLQAGAISYRSETVDVGSQIRRVLARINQLPDFQLCLGESGPFAHADPLRVRQIIRNLLVNANRYARSAVRVTTRETDDRVIAEFRNDGDPVAPEVVEVLFEPYQNGKGRTRTFGSIGLGLPVSRRLAQAMGGDLTYAYENGWCVFTVDLPRAPSPLPNPEPLDRAGATRL